MVVPSVMMAGPLSPPSMLLRGTTLNGVRAPFDDVEVASRALANR